MTPWPDDSERKAVVDKARALTRERLKDVGELPSKNAPKYIPVKERRKDNGLKKDTNA